MASQIQDRVKETTTTTGTGALTLAGAMTGFRAFSSVCAIGDTFYYALQAVDSNGNPTGAWETGIGTYSAANTLTRTTFLASSTGAFLSLAAGTTQVWLDWTGTAIKMYTAFQNLSGVSVPSANLNDVLSFDGVSLWQAKRLRISAGNSPSGTWVPALTKFASVTFSNGNRTFLVTSTPAGYTAALSAVPCSGKCYFEIVVTTSAGQSVYGAGPANVNTSASTGATDARPGIAQQGFGYQSSSGSMFVNASSTAVGSLGAGVSGDVIGFAYDAVAGKVWMRKNAGGWNNGAITAQDPANGIGGITVNPPSGTTFVPTAGIGTINGSATINQGDIVAFSGVPPLGFLGASGLVPGVVPDDVQITSLQDGDLFTWSATQGKFVNTPQALVRADGNRNLFVDGQADSWLGGTNNSLATVPYSADMFHALVGAGGTATCSQQLHAVGDNPANSPILPTFFQRWTQSVASTATSSWTQRLESVLTAAGQSVTFSIGLKASAAMTLTSLFCNQNFGAGGSTTVVNTKTVNWAIGTTWQRFSVRIDIPSIAGLTVGTLSLLNIGLILPAGVTFTLDSTQWQVEISSPNSSSDINGAGGAPTNYCHRGYQAEQARVARYIRNLIDNRAAGTLALPTSASLILANTLRVAIPLSPPMAQTPALLFPVGSGAQMFASSPIGASCTAAAVSAGLASPDTMPIDFSIPTSALALGACVIMRGGSAAVQMLADARL
jgi:hypothetical protein